MRTFAAKIAKQFLPVGALLLAASSASFTVSAADATKSAGADSWPQRPLKFVVPYPPGGPLDSMARMLAEKVRDDLGQPVIVENKAGAGGNIGADLVARSAPDGYSLVMGAVATHAINPWLFANLPYDPVKDFSPVDRKSVV